MCFTKAYLRITYLGSHLNTKEVSMIEQLFWELYNSHYESEITKIISENSIFEKPENWRPYGDNKGNFGTFESQQNHPVPALVEKITNSIDAILIKERCV